MKKTFSIALGTALTAILVSPLFANPGRHQRVRGEILEFEQQVRLGNVGEFDRLTIRTRRGKEMRLRLRSVGPCPDCYRVGDEIRARLGARVKDGEDHPVEKMRLQRGSRTFEFRLDGDRTLRHHRQAGGHRGHHGGTSRSQGGGRPSG